jgi:hypothetical protein
MPNSTIARVADGIDRELLVRCLDLLQADDVAVAFTQPFKESGNRPLTPLTLNVAIRVDDMIGERLLSASPACSRPSCGCCRPISRLT